MLSTQAQAARRVFALVPVLSIFMTASVLAATHTVPAGGDLQAALDAAQPGDVITLAQGGIYVGNFRLPVKDGDRYITLRTGGTGLPGAGVRMSPHYAPRLAVIKSPNALPALATTPG